MNKKSLSFVLTDIVYLFMTIVPFLFAMILKILTNAPSSGVDITGADVYFTIPMPIQNLPVTESQVNSLCVLIAIAGLCLFLTHGITKGTLMTRHHIAEWIVEKVQTIVIKNMGEYFRFFTPFIIAILALSGFSSLIALLGLYAPTSDINIVGGWALVSFAVITYYKSVCGPVQYIKSFGDPVPFLAPLNIISEIATPIAMAFRHYGNVLSGAVISVLVATGLQGLSSMIFKFLPGFLGGIPFLQIGIPAILSIYFDIFSGCLQAYIFAMLTMLYVAGGFPADLYEQKQKNKKKKLIGGN